MRAVPSPALLAAPVLALAGPAVLVGVVVSPAPGRSTALLACDGRARAVQVGESACGAELVAVSAGSVTVEADGQRRELQLGAAAPLQLAPPSAAPEAARPGERTLARAEVERRLAQEIPRILAETTLLPVTEDGRVTGFALTRLPDGSLVSDAGLQPGDVLVEINGTPVDSLATLAGLFTRLRQESDIQARVLRGGSPVTLTVRLR